MMDPETAIEYGYTMKNFLASDAGKAVFTELGELYVREWKTASDQTARENAWAKARALDDLKLAFQVVAETGMFEVQKQERAARKK